MIYRPVYQYFTTVVSEQVIITKKNHFKTEAFTFEDTYGYPYASASSTSYCLIQYNEPKSRYTKFRLEQHWATMCSSPIGWSTLRQLVIPS
jgi:hypothetical protein